MHVLLVKTSSLGDVVHNLPVVSDIQRHFPGTVIDWVVEEAFADIPRLHPGVRRVIPVALRRWRRQIFTTATWREISAFREDLKHDVYDIVLDTQGLIKSALIANQAELAVDGRRLGYSAQAAREPFAARFYSAGFDIAKNAHAIERNRTLAAAAFGYAPDQMLDYGIQLPNLAIPLVATQLGNWLPPQPYAVFFTGTSRNDKLWPEADWIALALALKDAAPSPPAPLPQGERGGVAPSPLVGEGWGEGLVGREKALNIILPAGNDAERQRVERLASNIPGAIVAPPLRIAELAGLLGGAQLVVGLDTGLTHLAVALNKPTVAVFAGSDPLLTGVLAPSPPAPLPRGEREPHHPSPLVATEGSPRGREGWGEGAINLGGKGSPPTATEVIAAARGML